MIPFEFSGDIDDTAQPFDPAKEHDELARISYRLLPAERRPYAHRVNAHPSTDQKAKVIDEGV
jgi:hypothetical protein